jgi:hypothetical protein
VTVSVRLRSVCGPRPTRWNRLTSVVVAR